MSTMISTRRLFLSCAAALVTTALAAVPRHTPLAGTWQADVSRSQFKGRAPYRSGRMRFVPENGDNVHVIADVITANGAMFHFEYSGPENGTALPVTGNPYYDSAAMHWQDDRTLVRTELRAGKPIGTTTIVLAADGQSFVATSSRSTPEDGHLYTSTILWKRVSD
ncbi:MAG TPA: hypothetical protein VHC20_03140 [Candidatus Paceibacterota bacterium]|jgi:hypothetical protein|nr:hypothetical protein [Candidatus Paceibacterota bacterium]